MTNTKSTKRALIASALSVLMCISMLIGSTFAWFTDSAATGVSNIVAGTLDIDLVGADGTTLVGKTIGFVDMDENDLWEPGCRYTLEEIKLVNNGTLNAKYKVVISATVGDVDLAEVIDVYEGETKLGTLRSFLDMTEGFKEGVIAPGETLAFGTLTLVMKESAGNEYQGKAISDIAITVLATQATSEKDSIDDQYDAGAEFISYENILTRAEVEALGKSDSKIEVEDTYISGEVNFINTFANGTDAWSNNGEASTLKDSEIAVQVTSPLPVATNYATAIVAANNSTFENVVSKNSTYVGEGTVATVYDLLAYQNQTTKLIGGEYGIVAVQPNGAMIVEGAKIDQIDTGARNNSYTAAKDLAYGLGGGLFVRSGSDIGTIFASSVQGNSNVAKAASGGKLLKIVVEAGADVDEIILDTFDTTSKNFIVSISAEANVGKIILNGTEYTQAEWLASGYND